MRRVIAAVAPDSAAPAVLATASAIGRLFGAEVDALHVEDSGVAASGPRSISGVPIRRLSGPTVETLVRAASEPDVVAVVIGARAHRDGKRPAGSTALALITSQRRPTVVVPPEAPLRERIESILVPLDGTVTSAAALESIVELAQRASLRIVVAHVHARHSLPAFTDHLPHEVRAWGEEFIARHCPAAVDAALELRVGDPHEHLLAILRDTRCDLVALGWRQRLAGGHAAVVRGMLASSPVPVLLTPVSALSAREHDSSEHVTARLAGRAP